MDGKDQEPGDALPSADPVQAPEKLSGQDKQVQEKLKHVGDGKTPG